MEKLLKKLKIGNFKLNGIVMFKKGPNQIMVSLKPLWQPKYWPSWFADLKFLRLLTVFG